MLWGTLFPVVSEALTGEKETIDTPSYIRVEVPIGLFLLFLTGVGPLVAWRKSSLDSLRRAFLGSDPDRDRLLSPLCLRRAFVTSHALSRSGSACSSSATILGEFWKGSRSIQMKEHIALPRAAFELTWRNTRRYGGYLVHMGIVPCSSASPAQPSICMRPIIWALGRHPLRSLRHQAGECPRRLKR